MQKFTRPLTREIALGDGRLALTLTEQGISVRPVGSRKPPWEVSWAAVLCQLTGAEDVAAAVERLKKGDAPRATAAASPTAGQTSEPTPASGTIPSPAPVEL
jgi:hypothetical protein